MPPSHFDPVFIDLPADTLVVWKLSRRARSLAQAIDTVKTMHERDIGLRVLTQNINLYLRGSAVSVHDRGI